LSHDVRRPAFHAATGGASGARLANSARGPRAGALVGSLQSSNSLLLSEKRSHQTKSVVGGT
jgi:hypothetical protein